MTRNSYVVAAVLCGALAGPSGAGAQVTKSDYERAQGLSQKYRYLTVNVPDPPLSLNSTPVVPPAPAAPPLLPPAPNEKLS